MGIEATEQGVQMSLLSDEQRAEIHYAACRVLRTVGVVHHEPRALDILAEAGCDTEAGADRAEKRVYYPTGLVEWAIDAAPSTITLWHRDRTDNIKLQGRNVYFGNGPTTLNVTDVETGEIREGTKDDIRQAARLVDYLENIDYCMSYCLSLDKPSSVMDCHEFDAMLRNCRKPIAGIAASDSVNTQSSLKLLYAEAGSKERAIRKPRAAFYSETTSPLTLDANAAENALMCAEVGYPTILSSIPQSGASSPVTMAGTLVVTVAEFLSELVLTQLVNEGAPVIMGTVGSSLDIEAAQMTYSGPELSLISTGIAEMGERYEIPTFGTAGSTDSKAVDAQAGWEAGHNVTTAAMSGTNMLHDVGYMASGQLSSMEFVLINDHVIEMAKRYVEGIDVTGETLMEELIEDVGPGGDFLNRQETLDRVEESHFVPVHDVNDRRSIDEWRTDPTTAYERANEEVKRILEEHEVPELDEDKRDEMDAIMREVTEHHYDQTVAE